MNGRKKKVLFFQENLYREINQFYFVFSRARNALMYIQFVFRFAIVQSKKIASTLLMQLLGYLIIEHKYIFIKTREREREKNNHFAEEKTDLGCVQIYKCTKL